MSIKPAPRTVEPLALAFATVLRRRRLAQDLSQEALARRADVLSFFGWQPDAGQRPPPTRARLADGHAARPALPACVDSGTPAQPLTVRASSPA